MRQVAPISDRVGRRNVISLRREDTDELDRSATSIASSSLAMQRSLLIAISIAAVSAQGGAYEAELRRRQYEYQQQQMLRAQQQVLLLPLGVNTQHRKSSV